MHFDRCQPLLLLSMQPARAPCPIARLGPITVTVHTHRHTTIHRHARCCKRRPHMTTTHLGKHGGAFCCPSPSLPLPLLPSRSRVPSCGCTADYSHRTHTPTHHHTQTCSLLQTPPAHGHGAPGQARRRVLLAIAPAIAGHTPLPSGRYHCLPHCHCLIIADGPIFLPLCPM